ncbi:Odorant receptor 85b, partial [Gryllus bimaculatus]
QIFCVFYMYIITSVIDTLFVSMMIYISALLRVLATDLSTLRQKSRKDFDTRNTKQREFRSVRSGAAADEEKMELALVGAIEFHQRIVHAVDEMQAVTSGPVLVQFVISTSVMCLALFATTANEEVVLAAYGSSWFDGSQEFKKRVLFIILRAQRTLAFRGGAFYELSRNTFLY